jgi:hypothetical protein
MNQFILRRQLNCTIWCEAIWEIFTVKDTNRRLLLSDDPVVLFNVDCFPLSEPCQYPMDPHPFWRGTRVLFPLSSEKLLVLSHVQHVDRPSRTTARVNRRNARSHGKALLNFTKVINDRYLTEVDVLSINFAIHARASRYIASHDRENLYPEREVSPHWPEINGIFYSRHQSWHSHSEVYIGHKDGGLTYSNAFGEDEYVPAEIVAARKATEAAGKAAEDSAEKIADKVAEMKRNLDTALANAKQRKSTAAS